LWGENYRSIPGYFCQLINNTEKYFRVFFGINMAPLYSDFNQTAPTQDPLVRDLDSIYQSISNILSTRKNTRLFLPEFGSEIEDLLFEPLDELTAKAIYDAVVVAIQRWEPRVTIDYSRSYVTPDYEKYLYNVSLTFSVKGLDSNNFYVFGGILRRNT